MGCHIDCLSTDNLQNRRFFFSFFFRNGKRGTNPRWGKKKNPQTPAPPPCQKKVLLLRSSPRA